MTQDWNLPNGTNAGVSVTCTTNLPKALKSLRDLFAGDNEPTNPVAFMFWLDTSGTGVLKQRDSTNTIWAEVAPTGVGWTEQTVVVDFGSVSATTTKYLIAMPRKGNVRQVRVLSDTATVASVAATTEWDFMLRNITAAADLFSATPGTATNVVGVGGGSELVANTPEIFTPDQNGLVNLNNVLEFTITKVGSPTSPLSRVVVLLDFDLIDE